MRTFLFGRKIPGYCVFSHMAKQEVHGEHENLIFSGQTRSRRRTSNCSLSFFRTLQRSYICNTTLSLAICNTSFNTTYVISLFRTLQRSYICNAMISLTIQFSTQQRLHHFLGHCNAPQLRLQYKDHE